MRFFLLLTLVCFVSCTQKNTRQNADIIKQWNGKQIIFPSNVVFTRYATDTVNYTIPESEYKILVYVDSFGCTGCMLQGAMWKDFINYIDSVTCGNVPFLFFFNPKDRYELSEILKSSELDMPVCVDENDALNELNRFHNAPMFKTFLLDSNNRVNIIGNPVYSGLIEKLYIKRITGKEYEGISPIKTEAMSNQTETDIGICEKNETKETTFQIRNTGKRPLVIYSVDVSNDFITSEFENTPVLPNEYVVLHVKIIPVSAGYFNETITVECNTKENINIQIKGKVE
ncbi:MAG: DUF1573 domain-containing protein [Bacteroidales bacterium]|jgi:hypothetical protein|nr:DUF1573 domain-containing protein [Bacteroidales bacterium]